MVPVLIPITIASYTFVMGNVFIFRKKLIILLFTIIYILIGVLMFAQLGYATAIIIWSFALSVLRILAISVIVLGIVYFGWRYAWRKLFPVSYFLATNKASHLKMLGRAAVPLVMEALIAKGKAGTVDNRKRLIDLLGQIDDVRATEALVELLRSDDCGDMAESALVNGADPVVPVIVKAVQQMIHNEQDALVRARAMIVLGRIGSMKAVIAIRSGLSDQNIYVRLQAALVLVEKGIMPTVAEEQSLFNGVAQLADYLKLRASEVDSEKHMRTNDVEVEPITAEQMKSVIDFIMRGKSFRVDYVPAKIHREEGAGWDWRSGARPSVPVVDAPARWDIVVTI